MTEFDTHAHPVLTRKVPKLLHCNETKIKQYQKFYNFSSCEEVETFKKIYAADLNINMTENQRLKLFEALFR